MKATKDFRGRSNDAGAEDSVKRAAKLDPIKKSGKERHALYSQIDEDEDMELLSVMKRDSILDYFDDGQEEDDELDIDEDDEQWEDDEEEDELDDEDDEQWEDDEEEDELDIDEDDELDDEEEGK